MSTVLTADNSTLHSQIGSKVCQAIIAIQVQQPELLLDKYRDIPWQSSRHQSGLVNKLTEILGQTQDEKLTQQLLQKFLRALLSPESFSSPILINLFKEVSQLGSSKPDGNGASTSKISESESETNLNVPSGSSGSTVNDEPIKSTPETENPTNNAPQAAIVDQETQENVDTTKDTSESNTSESNTSETTNNTPGAIDDNTNNAAYTQGGVAVLLLDAENLQFNSETEKFLSSVCNYPIQVKVAFANWCRKGKLDAELHARNYDLIHVPSGRDNADGKMITFGSSINQRFPNAKEVFVCSSDNVMTNLCNHMMQNGLNVFRVVKQGSNLTVLDIQSGKTHVHTVLPTMEQFVSQIKDIIREEESRTGNQWMKLSKMSKIFHNKYHIGVNQVVSHHFQGKTAKDIFLEHAEFAVHHLPEDLETFITLFKLPAKA
ncbi:hypothetical protein DSM106972_037230 [Dulcicalothrix desertica PCC 7102]|uniref:NYN domain-containing protein n=1 Tax=Dulcicalothrix desertica PCC 7102 TaxID=232991 RepID=A0A3S5K395_9CYAN|nr:hypothetical protein [Dulcicalothrix desertica]RUT05716.1 hypothetical protein DSM106972_037230 [Dulcicalothrix desertica PCC 7102]